MAVVCQEDQLVSLGSRRLGLCLGQTLPACATAMEIQPAVGLGSGECQQREQEVSLHVELQPVKITP